MLDALGVIGTSAYILRRWLGDDPRAVRHIERIADHVARCQQTLVTAPSGTDDVASA